MMSITTFFLVLFFWFLYVAFFADFDYSICILPKLDWYVGVGVSTGRVGFVPNPDSTRSDRVEQKHTRNQPPTTTGRIGRAQGGERSGRSSPMMSVGGRRRSSFFADLS